MILLRNIPKTRECLTVVLRSAKLNIYHHILSNQIKMINWCVNINIGIFGVCFTHIIAVRIYLYRWTYSKKNTKNQFLLFNGNIINFILIDVRKPITWSISIIVVSHLSYQLCKNIYIHTQYYGDSSIYNHPCWSFRFFVCVS